MTISLPLALQTSYADLLDQLRATQSSEFPQGSTYRARTISGKRYWYVQEPSTHTRREPERYLGADTPALRRRIEAGKRLHADAKARRLIVKALLAGGLPRVDALTGAILEVLSQAGAFRLRCVLVGSHAFATYAAHLGVRLPAQSVRTGDVDLAQDYGVSLKLESSLDRPLIDLLRSVDPDFEPVAYPHARGVAASFMRPGGYRVDVVTTNRGAERAAPVHLPALHSDATPLRFLDFLLRDVIDAAVLHRAGILVHVPQPARFAVHKLILAARRRGDAPKARKDLSQAELLIDVLAARHGDELVDAWREARARGPKWRQLLDMSYRRLSQPAQSALKSR